MYPLLETIRLENGRLANLDLHEKRLQKSLILLFGYREIPPINEMIRISGQHENGILKCRLLYSTNRFRFIIEPYKKRRIIHLLLVEKPEIKYDLKYSDRRIFENLIKAEVRETEVLITQNQFLTDTTYTNIALKFEDSWITPESPLLEGTQRALLLQKGILQPGRISTNDIGKFSKIRLFNAMMPWDDCIELDVSQILRDD
jgi:4-amino-4-deoxychorismate lyase